MRAELVVDASRLESFRTEWDALAEAAGRPYGAPGWLLPWFEHAAPDGAVLRAVVAVDGEGLAGIAPFFGHPGGRYEMLGARACSGVEPLTRPGLERAFAEEIARTLAAADPVPRALAFDGLPSGSPWPGLVAGAWPDGKPTLVVDRAERCPFAAAGTYDEWFAAKSGHFRKRMRRARRELEERGVSFRLAGVEGLPAFLSLHSERWADLGGSGVVNPGVERMLPDAARELGPERFRLWLAEAEGEPICAEILVAAGTTSTFWLGGFAAEWASAQPSMQTMLRALEHGFESGDRRVELGEGGQDFKYRLSDGDEELRWTVVVPPGRGALRTRLGLRAGAARRGLSARVPAGVKQVLRRRPARG